MPDPQTLLIVVVGTATGRPAARLACRAGACPSPAWRTAPTRASPMSAGGTPASARQARAAVAKSSGAPTGDSAP